MYLPTDEVMNGENFLVVSNDKNLDCKGDILTRVARVVRASGTYPRESYASDGIGQHVA